MVGGGVGRGEEKEKRRGERGREIEKAFGKRLGKGAQMSSWGGERAAYDSQTSQLSTGPQFEASHGPRAQERAEETERESLFLRFLSLAHATGPRNATLSVL